MSKIKKSEIESERFEEIELMHPTLGLIKQVVKITRYKSAKDTTQNIIMTNDPIINNTGFSELLNAAAPEDGE